MSECSLDLQKDHENRITKSEIKIEDLKEKVNKLDGIETAITKISTLFDVLVKDSDKRDELRKQQGDLLNQQSITLSKINSNLDGLNTDLKETKAKVDKLETAFECKIEKIESKFSKSEEKGKIDVIAFIVKYWAVILLGAGSILGVLKYTKVI